MSNQEKFFCTRGWVDRFKRRYNIKSGKIHGEAGAVNTDIPENWLTTVWPGTFYSNTTLFFPCLQSRIYDCFLVI
jgi:hypothetical protein